MKQNYFEGVVKNLQKEMGLEVSSDPRLDFPSLKILEYWVRFLHAVPDCVNIRAIGRYMDDKHLKKLVDSVSQEVMRIKEKQGENLVDQDDVCVDDLDDEIEDDTVFWASLSKGNKKESKKLLGKTKARIKNRKLLINQLNRLNEVSLGSQGYFYCMNKIGSSFVDFSLKALKKGVSPDDVCWKNVCQIQKDFRLSDEEMELVVFLWLSDRPELRIEMDDDRPFRMRESLNLNKISLATGFSKAKLMSLLNSKSPLVQMGIVSSNLELDDDFEMRLEGVAGNTVEHPFFASPAPIVACEMMLRSIPEAKILLETIKSHDRSRPLNILLYGKEGTGKTELSRAIAEELHRPLWEISLDLEQQGGRYDIKNSLVRFRLRALILADWQCERDSGIILMDEADLVLNGAEKGMLNHIFEEIRSPIIWVANSVSHMEASTARRFDYSIKFEALGKAERKNVLDSVLKVRHAENFLSEKEKMRLSACFPAMAGGFTKAFENAKALLSIYPEYSAEAAMEAYLKAHTQILGLSEESIREMETHAPSYALDALNIDHSVDEILKATSQFNEKWKNLDANAAPISLNILLYGAPGTGKTEFVRYIARSLGRELIVKRASDILNMYVGETEAKIRQAFREAEKAKAILFFDEADSFLRDRSGAVRGFEATQVNEMLTQMENFNGIFIAATNFDKVLDAASRRRFAFKIKFDFLKPEGVQSVWNAFFPEIECPESARQIPMLAPGDFNAINGRLHFLPREELTADRIEAELRKELQAKDSHAGRRMGL